MDRKVVKPSRDAHSGNAFITQNFIIQTAL